MRFFTLLNFQHVMAYLFVGLLFVVLFGLALAFTHFHGPDTPRRQKEIINRYAEGLASRRAPFPLVMTLTIIGVVIWGVIYTLMYGLMGVRI
jgi:hypothetical protein